MILILLLSILFTHTPLDAVIVLQGKEFQNEVISGESHNVHGLDLFSLEGNKLSNFSVPHHPSFSKILTKRYERLLEQRITASKCTLDPRTQFSVTAEQSVTITPVSFETEAPELHFKSHDHLEHRNKIFRATTAVIFETQYALGINSFFQAPKCIVRFTHPASNIKSITFIFTDPTSPTNSIRGIFDGGLNKILRNTINPYALIFGVKRFEIDCK